MPHLIPTSAFNCLNEYTIDADKATCSNK